MGIGTRSLEVQWLFSALLRLFACTTSLLWQIPLLRR
jgi:hypothetical protein